MQPRLPLFLYTILAVLAQLVGTTETVAHKPVTAKYTFNEHIRPIFQTYCGGCHAPGRIAPMSLLTYQEAYPWAESIKEVLLAESLHPWHVEEGVGAFTNGRWLTARELDMVIDWATGSAPEGSPSPTPAPVAGQEEWPSGPPDLVLTMADSLSVGAETMEKTRCIVLPTGLTTDRWVTGLDVRPGNPAIVHDAVIYTVAAGQGFAQGRGTEAECADGTALPAEQIVGTWFPDQPPPSVPEDAAYRLPAGSPIILRIHYRKTWRYEGREMKDRSAVGLYFAKRPVEKRIRTAVIRQATTAPSDTLTAVHVLESDAHLTSILPQISVPGAIIQATVVRPDGTTVWLVKVKSADPAWPIRYDVTESVPLPRGSRIAITASVEQPERLGPSRLAVWVGYTVDGEHLHGGGAKTVPQRRQR
ncbi:MAG: hypothetical protein HY710_04060 [Candidatus Latescibacteria bacterium]|nr:hypothetical protein [Candidatus Latescibacterota bacterium]